MCKFRRETVGQSHLTGKREGPWEERKENRPDVGWFSVCHPQDGGQLGPWKDLDQIKLRILVQGGCVAIPVALEIDLLPRIMVCRISVSLDCCWI